MRALACALAIAGCGSMCPVTPPAGNASASCFSTGLFCSYGASDLHEALDCLCLQAGEVWLCDRTGCFARDGQCRGTTCCGSGQSVRCCDGAGHWQSFAPDLANGIGCGPLHVCEQGCGDSTCVENCRALASPTSLALDDVVNECVKGACEIGPASPCVNGFDTSSCQACLDSVFAPPDASVSDGGCTFCGACAQALAACDHDVP